MTEKEIVDNNGLIANFMGWELSIKGKKFKKGEIYPYGYIKVNQKYLYFNISWDWIIPVCEKWDNLDEYIIIGYNEDYIDLCDELDHFVTLYNIDMVYEHIIKCIKWYNKYTNE